MDALWSQMTLQDRIVLGLIALVPSLMVFAIYLIRSEIKQAVRHVKGEPPRPGPTPLRLKTTESQRAQCRVGRPPDPQAIMDLADDVETLLKRVRADS
jgi:hypothetical protein